MQLHEHAFHTVARRPTAVSGIGGNVAFEFMAALQHVRTDGESRLDRAVAVGSEGEILENAAGCAVGEFLFTSNLPCGLIWSTPTMTL